ncbi:hypothetical protein HMPREF1585_01435 [Gardnerella vaginalis JCP8481B]|nr:hypothetical protein HMPREF1585_01435 [Gardnerella vaginalis JCP8481B]
MIFVTIRYKILEKLRLRMSRHTQKLEQNFVHFSNAHDFYGT